MNYHPISALLALTLFGMGVIALVLGLKIYSENKKSKSDLHMFMVCVCVFIWDFGYAWMSLCHDSDFAYVPRALALLAVYLYMAFILNFVLQIKKFSKVPWSAIMSLPACGFSRMSGGDFFYNNALVPMKGKNGYF